MMKVKGETEENVGGAGPVPFKHFPTPKFVIDITTPVVVTVDSTAVKEAWEDDVIKSTERSYTDPPSPSSTGKRKKKTKFKMQSLVLKMLNRLIREEIVPYEAISFSTSGNYLHARILATNSVVPIILLRCEHIGVGNGVGLCYVIPLETSLVPKAMAGPTKQVMAENTDRLLYKSQPASKSEAQTVVTEVRTSSTEPLDDDSESVSTAEEEEDEDEGRLGSMPGSVFVPFLTEEKKEQLNEQIFKARKEWRDTASKVRVAQVVEEVSAAAAFTLDYFAFVVCASIVATVGLVTNSGVTVIASMLISPILGPVMGFTFGTTVRQKPLIRTSLRNELASLLICVIVGMLLGIVSTVTGVPERRDWPSDEMTSRGDPVGLVSGILVALPSGVAVALSTLGKNSSGLVGVAISLSLLPPAVNAGICIVYELMLLSDRYDRNEGDDTDYWQAGVISFLLTTINIICIWISGVTTFWLKEVAPLKQKNAFWSNDLAVYRQAKDSPDGADLDVINDGIKARLELQEAAAADGEMNTGEPDLELGERDVVAARRRSLAANATEDALFLDNRALDGPVVPGGAVSDALPSEIDLQNAPENTAKASLFRNANKFGGLTEAGEALFDNDIIGIGSASFRGDSRVYTDAGIQHENVAEQVLLQDFH